MDLSAAARAGALSALFVIFLVDAPGAAAQACLGLPQGSVGGSAFTLGFPKDAMEYGLEGTTANQDTGLLLTGEFSLLDPDVEAFEDTKEAGGWLGWEIEPLRDQVSLCPRVGLAYQWVGVLNALTIPFGVAVGRTLDITWDGSAGITPFAMPQFLWTRHSRDDIDVTSTETVFALTGGLALNIGVLVIGGRASKIFEEGNDPVFSAFVGAAWR